MGASTAALYGGRREERRLLGSSASGDVIQLRLGEIETVKQRK